MRVFRIVILIKIWIEGSNADRGSKIGVQFTDTNILDLAFIREKLILFKSKNNCKILAYSKSDSVDYIEISIQSH